MRGCTARLKMLATRSPSVTEKRFNSSGARFCGGTTGRHTELGHSAQRGDQGLAYAIEVWHVLWITSVSCKQEKNRK